MTNDTMAPETPNPDDGRPEAQNAPAQSDAVPAENTGPHAASDVTAGGEQKAGKRKRARRAKKNAAPLLDAAGVSPEPQVEATPAPAETPAETSEPAAALAEAAETSAAATSQQEETPQETPAESSMPTDSSSETAEPATEQASETDGPQADGADEAAPGEAADETAGPAKAPVDPEELMRTIEALLFAAEEPLAVREIARAAGSDSNTVRKLLPNLKAAYAEQKRPWDVAEVAGGYRLLTRPEYYPAIQRLKTQTAQRKLTQAALETLALIAYRQPLGRAEIESVRGVGAGPVLRQLLDKKLVRIAGRGAGLGHPLLYGTTAYFLEHFGLKSIEDLPKPGEFKGA